MLYMCTVRCLGNWLPRKDVHFPAGFRAATRTLLVLAKARPVLEQSKASEEADPSENTHWIVRRYSVACLELLPEELLQHILAYLVVTPLPKNWLPGFWEYKPQNYNANAYNGKDGTPVTMMDRDSL